MTITNPQNSHSESISYFDTFTSALLFGGIYLIYRKIWNHFIIFAILAVATFGLIWLVYPFFMYWIVKNHYLKIGWMVE